MDTLSFPEHVQLALVAGPKAARPQMLALAARLALRGQGGKNARSAPVPDGEGDIGRPRREAERGHTPYPGDTALRKPDGSRGRAPGQIPSAVRVLDGGNSFDAYAVARALRAYTPRVEPILARIRVQRAFTCYQMLTLLEETPPDPAPTLVLDALSTFQDESVYLAERRRLLGECILRLRVLSQAGLVVVSARLPDQQAGTAGLFALLEAACEVRWAPLPPEEPPEPPLLPGFS